MSSNELGIGTTTLAVRLPVRLVGRLYLAAGESNRNVSSIVGGVLEEWLQQTETPDGSPSTAKAGSPRTSSRGARRSASSKEAD